MALASAGMLPPMISTMDWSNLDGDLAIFRSNTGDLGYEMTREPWLMSSYTTQKLTAPGILHPPVPYYGRIQSTSMPGSESGVQASPNARNESSLTPVSLLADDPRVNTSWRWCEHTTDNPTNWILVCPMPHELSGQPYGQVAPMNKFIEHLSSKHI